MHQERTTQTELLRFWTDKYKILSLFLVCLSLLLFLHFETRPKVKTPSDLQATSGWLVSYSFVDGARGTHMYYLRLDSCTSTFQIPAGFLDYFEKSNFESKIRLGDSITVEFPKTLIDSINTNDKMIHIFSIKSNDHSFLDRNACIRSYKNDYFLVFIFMIPGLLLLYARSAYLAKHPKSSTPFLS